MSDSVTRSDKLSAIAGRWNTSGCVIGDPRLPVEGTDIYEVFPGGHFIVHHVDVAVGGQKVRAIEVIGEPDPDSDAYLARSFDSNGNFEVMKLRIEDDGTFHFAGGGDVARTAQVGDAPTAQVRSTLIVSQDRASMKAFWERSEDGIDWHPGWTSRSHAANDACTPHRTPPARRRPSQPPLQNQLRGGNMTSPQPHPRATSPQASAARRPTRGRRVPKLRGGCLRGEI